MKRYLFLVSVMLLAVLLTIFIFRRDTQTTSEEISMLTGCSEQEKGRLQEIIDDSNTSFENRATANFRLTDCNLRSGNKDAAKEQAEKTLQAYEEAGDTEGAEQAERVLESLERKEFIPPEDADEESNL